MKTEHIPSYEGYIAGCGCKGCAGAFKIRCEIKRSLTNKNNAKKRVEGRYSPDVQRKRDLQQRHREEYWKAYYQRKKAKKLTLIRSFQRSLKRPDGVESN